MVPLRRVGWNRLLAELKAISKLCEAMSCSHQEEHVLSRIGRDGGPVPDPKLDSVR